MKINRKILTAEEMCNITKAERDKWHDAWLETIHQGILKAAKNGLSKFIFDCGSQSDLEELRNIYEPLGYEVDLYCNGCTMAKISWEQES